MSIKRLSYQLFIVVLVSAVAIGAAIHGLSACRRAEPASSSPVTLDVESAAVDQEAHQTAEPTGEVVSPTPANTPSPAYPGFYTGEPTPNPTPANLTNGDGLESHVVQSGQTLGWIALVFGCTVDEIVAANDLASADSIRAGQTLVIPVVASEIGPDLKLVPDSEMVYGPAYIHFDLAGFVANQAGYLASYTERVEGRTLTGGEIVQLVAQRFSVGPRVLLALLEMQSGWVTASQPAVETLVYPIGHVQDYYEGLFQQLSWAAVRLNGGYYGWKYGNRTTMRLDDGMRVAVAPTLNPGTAGVQNCLAELAQNQEAWLALIGPEGFPATYNRLFGNPFAYAVEPLIPPDLAQPALRLPWEGGETWYLTGGPHEGWGIGSAWAAVDFVPGERMLGCTPSASWATAAAAGKVVRSENGVVIVDLDGDGFEQSGWTLLYLHVYADERVPAGAFVQQGERIGRPSCEGGVAEATHLHFARRYNGEWIPAGSGPLPMTLSGWTAQKDVMPYDGTMVKGEQTRTACECWEDDYNGLVSDNDPD